MDPLAELVKLDPKSIGVGQYQHDVDQGNLKRSLDVVVESCVNLVDVREVRGLGESHALETREMALARVHSGSGPFLTDRGRLLGQREDCDLIEITGTPHEVDAALADLADRGVLTGFHRTGELPAPEEMANKKRRSSE